MKHLNQHNRPEETLLARCHYITWRLMIKKFYCTSLKWQNLAHVSARMLWSSAGRRLKPVWTCSTYTYTLCLPVPRQFTRCSSTGATGSHVLRVPHMQVCLVCQWWYQGSDVLGALVGWRPYAWNNGSERDLGFVSLVDWFWVVGCQMAWANGRDSQWFHHPSLTLWACGSICSHGLLWGLSSAVGRWKSPAFSSVCCCCGIPLVSCKITSSFTTTLWDIHVANSFSHYLINWFQPCAHVQCCMHGHEPVTIHSSSSYLSCR